MPREYRHIQEYEKEILKLKSEGLTHRQIADGVSRSGYYGFVNRIDKEDKDMILESQIREYQQECRQTYGYRRVHIWLDKHVIHHNPKTVLRVMRKFNLLSVVRRKKYQRYISGTHRYENLLNRDFKADRPNQKWVY